MGGGIKISGHSIGEYSSGVKDSVSMACLGNLPFTITAVEKSDYEDKKGVVVTTKETFSGKQLELTDMALQNMSSEDVENFKTGEYNKFHTTRLAITNTLLKDKVQEDLKDGGTIGPVKCSKVKNPKRGGNAYWELIDAGQGLAEKSD